MRKHCFLLQALIALLFSSSIIAQTPAAKPAAKKPATKKAVEKKPAKQETIQLTFANNNNDIYAHVDQEINISLSSNASTGYSWNIGKPLDKGIKQLEGDYKSNPNKGKLVGVDGVQVVKFKVLKSGNSDISLAYSRSWETDKKAVEHFTIHVKVKP